MSSWLHMKLILSVSFLSILILSSCESLNESTEKSHIHAMQDLQKVCVLAEDFDWKKYDSKADAVVDFWTGAESVLTSEVAEGIIVASRQADRPWETFTTGAGQVGFHNPNCPKLKLLYNDLLYKLNKKLK